MSNSQINLKPGDIVTLSNNLYQYKYNQDYEMLEIVSSGDTKQAAIACPVCQSVKFSIGYIKDKTTLMCDCGHKIQAFI